MGRRPIGRGEWAKGGWAPMAEGGCHPATGARRRPRPLRHPPPPPLRVRRRAPSGWEERGKSLACSVSWRSASISHFFFQLSKLCWLLSSSCVPASGKKRRPRINDAGLRAKHLWTDRAMASGPQLAAPFSYCAEYFSCCVEHFSSCAEHFSCRTEHFSYCADHFSNCAWRVGCGRACAFKGLRANTT